MGPKYEFTDETKTFDSHVLHRIRRLSDNQLGGWIENEDNLSQEGDCWVDDEAYVFEDAKVYGNAKVSDGVIVSSKAQIYGNAKVSDRAYITNFALIFGNAEVYGDASVCNHARVLDNALVCGHAKVCDIAIVRDNAEVYGHAKVYGQAQIYGDAHVYMNAQIYDEAQIYGSAHIYGYTEICDNAKVRDDAQVYDATVCDTAEVYDNAIVSTGARICGNAKIRGNMEVNYYVCNKNVGNTAENSNSIVQDFIYKIDDSQKLEVQTEYDSIEEFFSEPAEDDLKLDTLIICAVDTKETLVKLQKINVKDKTEFKFIVDVTNEEGDNFSYKSTIKSQEHLAQLVEQTVEALRIYPQLSKYADDLENCL